MLFLYIWPWEGVGILIKGFDGTMVTSAGRYRYTSISIISGM